MPRTKYLGLNLHPSVIALAVNAVAALDPSLAQAHTYQGSGPKDSSTLRAPKGQKENEERQSSDGRSQQDIEKKTAPSGAIPEIIVTGTHIRGIGVSAGSPVISIDNEDIRRSGYATTQQIIQSLPQNFNGGVSEDTQIGADLVNNQTFSSGVNLRGLGNAGTLVLLNGRRMAGATTDAISPDISLIPTTAIERVEVLPDGASAVYGSDAVGGVVNFVLKSHYEGTETRLRYGVVTEGSLEEVQANQTFGISWSSGSLLVSGEYYRRDNLPMAKRTFSASSDQRSRGGTDWRTIYAVPGNILDPLTSMPIYAIPSGQNGRNLTTDEITSNTNTNYFDSNLYEDLLPKQKRGSVFSRIDQEIFDEFRVFLELFYARREYGVASIGPSLEVTVPNTNPFYIDVFGNGKPVRVAYNFQKDRGNVRRGGRMRQYQYVLGIDYNLDSNWNVRAYANYSRNTEKSENMGLDPNALSAALLDPNPDTALNVFGSGSSNNPNTIRKVFGLDISSSSRRILKSAQVIADGAILNLPGGQIKLAVGGEVYATKRNTRTSRHDRDVYAGFSELFFPVLGRDFSLNGVEYLNISFSIRTEKYKDRKKEPEPVSKRNADTVTPKIGLNLSVNGGLSLRGTYGTAFRAPSLTDLDDRKDVVYGVVPDDRSPSGVSRIILIQGGRSDLKNEKARTWTVGADYEPEWAPNARLGLTYYRIKFRDRIASSEDIFSMISESEFYPDLVLRDPSLSDVIAACSSTTFLAVPDEICSNSDLVDILVDVRTGNRAETTTDGFDAMISYVWRTQNAGNFNLSANANYILNFKQSPTSSSPARSILNTRGNPVDFKARAILSWDINQLFEVSTIVNYTNSYKNNIGSNKYRIRSHLTFDVAFSLWTGRWLSDDDQKNSYISLSALNIFNRKPPFVDIANGYDAANADPLGRFISLNISYEW